MNHSPFSIKACNAGRMFYWDEPIAQAPNLRDLVTLVLMPVFSPP